MIALHNGRIVRYDGNGGLEKCGGLNEGSWGYETTEWCRIANGLMFLPSVPHTRLYLVIRIRSHVFI